MPKHFDLAAARLDVSAEVVRTEATVLSDFERQRASRFAFDSIRTRFIVARATLRRLLAKRLGAQPADIEFVYGEQGKPALGARFEDSNLFFNVSHCDDLAVYAFSSAGEIGVDVEAVRWFADANDVAARVFSSAEQKAYAALHPLLRPLGFFNCWTRKEAFIKALGSGLQRPLDSFDVSLAPDEPAEILRVENTAGNSCGWAMESFVPAPGFVAAVVTENHGL
jgi:4'-phosphopantetheinyl transferase